MAQRPRQGIISDTFTPAAPRSVEESGLSMGLLTDLALKILYFESYLAGRDLADRMGLPFPHVVSTILDFLKREQLCEVRSLWWPGPAEGCLLRVMHVSHEGCRSAAD